MQRRYQQLPGQFIPKHNQKYIMRKTLVNTKFQWLMKYLHQDHDDTNQNNCKLSRAINIAPKPALKERNRKAFFENKPTTSTSNHWDHSIQPEDLHQPKIATNHSANLRRSILKSRNNTEPAENVMFLEKGKIKNQSLLLHKSNSKKISLLFGKQSHATITQKMRTTSTGIKRSRTGEVRRPKKEKQNFVLTPWILPEDNQENYDLAPFF